MTPITTIRELFFARVTDSEGVALLTLAMRAKLMTPEEVANMTEGMVWVLDNRDTLRAPPPSLECVSCGSQAVRDELEPLCAICARGEQ